MGKLALTWCNCTEQGTHGKKPYWNCNAIIVTKQDADFYIALLSLILVRVSCKTKHIRSKVTQMCARA